MYVRDEREGQECLTGEVSLVLTEAPLSVQGTSSPTAPGKTGLVVEGDTDGVGDTGGRWDMTGVDTATEATEIVVEGTSLTRGPSLVEK